MTQDREPLQESVVTPATSQSDVAPGRAATSSQLSAPKQPVTSALVQRKARDENGVAPGAADAVAGASSSSGDGLPTTVMRKFESSLGTDLSGVRVHTGAASQEAAGAVGARAYTQGQDIHFGAGQYDPSSGSGQQLLAHEVAHTVQQRGGTPTRQNKLEVSSPNDGAEHEADRAAEAMVTGAPASVSTLAGGTVSRGKKEGLADDMENEAGYGEQQAIQNPPPLLGAASSVDSTQQARVQIGTVQAASANLFHKKAHHERLKSEAILYSSKGAQDKIINETQGYIDTNNKCIASLQRIVDLGTGHALVDDKGHRAGYDTRASAFAGLYAVAIADFARVQGVVKAFLKTNPNVNAANEGDMGRAIATGKADGNTAKTHEQVEARLKQDEPLKVLVDELKSRMHAYEAAKFSEVVNTQIGDCTGATTGLRNVEIRQELEPNFPDSAKQTEAKAKVAKVQADLAAAKAGIDRIGKVVTLAAAVLGAPAVGALGEGSVLTKTIDDTKANPFVSDDTKANPFKGRPASDDGKSPAIPGVDEAAKTLADVDVGDKIKTEVAELMTDYEAKIDKANGDLDAANSAQAFKVLTLKKGEVAKARGDVNAKVDVLVKTLKDMKTKKDAIRDTASKIRAHQAKTGTKGGPDIAAIARAAGECTVFVESAKAAIVQGEEERKLAAEIAKERVDVAGKWNPGKKSFTEISPDGAPKKVQEVYGSSKEGYVDCVTVEPFQVTKKPIEFSIWNDEPMASPEIARGAFEPKLAQLKEHKQTIEGDKIALERAMFGQPV